MDNWNLESRLDWSPELRNRFLYYEAKNSERTPLIKEFINKFKVNIPALNKKNNMHAAVWQYHNSSNKNNSNKNNSIKNILNAITSNYKKPRTERKKSEKKQLESQIKYILDNSKKNNNIAMMDKPGFAMAEHYFHVPQIGVAINNHIGKTSSYEDIVAWMEHDTYEDIEQIDHTSKEDIDKAKHNLFELFKTENKEANEGLKKGLETAAHLTINPLLDYSQNLENMLNEEIPKKQKVKNIIARINDKLSAITNISQYGYHKRLKVYAKCLLTLNSAKELLNKSELTKDQYEKINIFSKNIAIKMREKIRSDLLELHKNMYKLYGLDKNSSILNSKLMNNINKLNSYIKDGGLTNLDKPDHTNQKHEDYIRTVYSLLLLPSKFHKKQSVMPFLMLPDETEEEARIRLEKEKTIIYNELPDEKITNLEPTFNNLKDKQKYISQYEKLERRLLILERFATANIIFEDYYLPLNEKEKLQTKEQNKSPVSLLQMNYQIDSLLNRLKNVLEKKSYIDKKLEPVISEIKKNKNLIQSEYYRVQLQGHSYLDSFVQEILNIFETKSFKDRYDDLTGKSNFGNDRKRIKKILTIGSRCPDTNKIIKNNITLDRQLLKEYQSTGTEFDNQNTKVCNSCNEKHESSFSFLTYATTEYIELRNKQKKLNEFNEQNWFSRKITNKEQIKSLEDEINLISEQYPLAWIGTRVKGDSFLYKLVDKLTGFDDYVTDKKKDENDKNAIKDFYGIKVIVANEAAKKAFIEQLYKKNKTSKRLQIPLNQDGTFQNEKDYWNEPKLDKNTGEVQFQGWKVPAFFDSLPAELQLQTQKMYDASEKDHPFYKERMMNLRAEFEKETGIPYSMIYETINNTFKI